MKECCRCNIVKPQGDFSPNKRAADGLNYACKACYRESDRARYGANREEINARARAKHKLNPLIAIEHGRKYRAKHPHRTMVLHARKRAAKFNLEFDLDGHIGAIKTRVDLMVCEMSGVKLVSSAGCGGTGKRHFNTPSIDRIDNARGYTYDNIRIVCWGMNCALGTWGEDVLAKIMKGWLREK